MQFKKWDLIQKRKGRRWARENYEPFTPIQGVWHPIVQAECVTINEENATFVMEVEDERIDKSAEL